MQKGIIHFPDYIRRKIDFRTSSNLPRDLLLLSVAKMNYQAIYNGIETIVRKNFQLLNATPIEIRGENWHLAMEPRTLIVVTTFFSRDCDRSDLYRSRERELLAVMPYWLRIRIYHHSDITPKEIVAMENEIIGLHFDCPQSFDKLWIWRCLSKKLDYLVYDIPYLLSHDILESYQLLLQTQFRVADSMAFCRLNVRHSIFINELLSAVKSGWYLQNLSLSVEYEIDATLGDFLRYNCSITELEVRSFLLMNEKFILDVMESLAYNQTLKHLTLVGTHLPVGLVSPLKWNSTLQHLHIAFNFSQTSYSDLLFEIADMLRHNACLLTLSVSLHGYYGMPHLTDFNPIDIALKYNNTLQNLQLKGKFINCDYFEFMAYNHTLRKLHVAFDTSCYPGLAFELQYHPSLVDITMPQPMKPETRRQIKSKLKRNARNNFVCPTLMTLAIKKVVRLQSVAKVADLRDTIPENVYNGILQALHDSATKN